MKCRVKNAECRVNVVGDGALDVPKIIGNRLQNGLSKAQAPTTE